MINKIESSHSFYQRIVNSVISEEITEEQAIKEIASRWDVNTGYAKQIFNNLMEDKSLIKSGIMEMANEMNQEFDLNGDLASWFEDYVHLNDKATTLGGELVRAANQIIARYENDGDKIGIGYGKETVNPAARYILAICNDYLYRTDIQEMLDNESRINYSDEEYGIWISQFEKAFTEYLRDHEEFFHAPNKEDMWNYGTDEDKNTSVDECYIVDNDGNEYWFQGGNGGWACSAINYIEEPEFNTDDSFDDEDEIADEIVYNGESSNTYGDIEKGNFRYSWEAWGEPDEDGNYHEWIFTNVSLMDGIAEVGDEWDASDFENYTVYDANGREILTSDLY